ncbi:MAG: glycosyltransferase family A protein [Planctomycetaceae bacterium]
MSQPLVSVVIPSFNHARFVTEAVDSVLAQTNCRLEIIVVDDGSTDNTRDVLAPYSSQIRYIYQENRGLPGARNTGIRAATGEWVAVLDSDDTWHPQKTERQLAAVAQHPEVDVVGSPGGDDPFPESLPLDPPTAFVSVRDFLLITPMSASSTMIRRRCFDAVGLFDETLRSAEDRDMWLRLAAKFKVLQVKSPCWFYRVHEGQMSRNPQRMYDNFRTVLDKFFREHPKHRSLSPMAYAFLYQDAAICYAEANQRFTAIQMILRSMWSYPGELGKGRFGRSKLLTRFLLGQGVIGCLKRATSAGSANCESSCETSSDAPPTATKTPSTTKEKTLA